MMTCLRLSRDRRAAAAVLALGTLLVGAAAAQPAPQAPSGAGTYTIYYHEGRRSLAVRASGPRDLLVFTLNQVSGLFNFKLVEDVVSGGLIIDTRGQRIIAVPGQSFVQVAGKVISLDGPVERERDAWIVPFDFLPKVVGPAIGQPIVVRRSSRLILVGDVRVPQITGRVERTASGGRVTIDVQPPAPRRVTRDGNRLVIRFDAVALDATPIPGSVANFITGVRIDGTSITIGLGTSAAIVRNEDEKDLAHIAIELLPPPPPPPPPPVVLPPVSERLPGRGVDPSGITPPARPEPPTADLTPGAIRTVVIDPGHGGTDAGAKGPSGAFEKDLVLDVAKRLKTAIEGRLGLRVLLTRDTDRDMPIDERSTLANTNKADLFVSLHANASVRAGLRGVQVLSLDAGDYAPLPTDSSKLTVPVIGGGSRAVAAVPWSLAQVPFAGRSAAFGVIVAGHLHERAVPLHPKATDLGPVRALASVNMPAVLIELGFLSNAEDEAGLANGTLGAAVIEAIIASIGDARRGVPGLDPARSER